jgi:arylsulfatase A-like enzyme
LLIIHRKKKEHVSQPRSRELVKPNILLLTVNSLSSQDFQKMVSSVPDALPTLTALSSRGIGFKSLYCSPRSLSLPPRDSIYRIISKNSLKGTSSSSSGGGGFDVNDDSADMLPSHLRQIGYRTVFIGGDEVITLNKYQLPPRRGFDVSVGMKRVLMFNIYIYM